MKPFKIYTPSKTKEAFQAFTSQKTLYVAGGTTATDLMKYHIWQPDRVINVNKLNFKGIELTETSIKIGSGETMTDIAYHPDIEKHFPGVKDGLLLAASQGIRNMATIGGNIMQRTRCPYYRNTTLKCNRREPGTGCDAMQGWNRYNAILGGSSKCIAAHFSDVSNVFAALEAVVHLEGESGKRKVDFIDFHLLPGDTPEKEHNLEEGELITSIEIPKTRAAANSCYVKIRDRNSYAFAISSAAAGLDIQEGVIQDAKIALGAVATKPWKVKEAENFLKGKSPSKLNFEQAAKLSVKGADIKEFNAFKKDLVQGALVEALTKLS